MKFHVPWLKYIHLWGQNMNNNYYFYEHYLASIALNLEVCFNLCEFYNIPKNSYCRSGKYSNHFVRLVQCTCVICCCACTNTQCVQCLVITCTKSGSWRINKNSQKNNVLRGLGLCIPIYHDVWTVKPLEDKWAKTGLLKNTVSFLKLYLH